MKENLVIAVDGKEYKKKECKRIEKQYWKIGDIKVKDSGHCYKINDKYYKYNTGYIVYNHTTGQYEIKKDIVNLIKGVVSFDKDIPLFGYFQKNTDNEGLNIFYQHGIYRALNEEILNNCFYFKESLRDGIFYNRTSINSILFTEPQPCDSSFKYDLPYDCKNITSSYLKKYESLYKPVINDSVKKYGDFIKDYTFGVEFETVKGFIPTRISDRLGLIPLRDGSIEGLEYVTVPLSGKKGLQALIDSCKELKKRTTYNNDCALHLHIGNLPRTEEFFLALFKLLISLEDEFYSLFPIYTKYNLGIKKKHYTKKFPITSTILQMDPVIDKTNIKKNFGILYKFLSSGQDYKYINNLEDVTGHPSDPEGTAKWNIKSRYYFINMIPLLFGNKETIEFRLHPATLDESKIVNYIAICTAILDYAKYNSRTILAKPSILNSLKLKDIIYQAFNNVSGYSMTLIENLYNYIDSRKEYIQECTRKGDILASEDNLHFYKQIDWDAPEKLKVTRKYKSKLDGLIYSFENDFHTITNNSTWNTISYGSVPPPEGEVLPASNDLEFQ